MALWALVPVKHLQNGKSRLAGVLSVKERAALATTWLQRTLRILVNLPAVQHTLVVSRDQRALRIARDLGVQTVSEGPAAELNAALERATEAARLQGAAAVLILPIDLPLLAAADLEALLADAGSGPMVVAAPDRHGSGTNALLVQPPGAIKYAFGPHSLQAHAAAAHTAGVPYCERKLTGLAMDVDLPEDLHMINGLANGKPA